MFSFAIFSHSCQAHWPTSTPDILQVLVVLCRCRVVSCVGAVLRDVVLSCYLVLVLRCVVSSRGLFAFDFVFVFVFVRLSLPLSLRFPFVFLSNDYLRPQSASTTITVPCIETGPTSIFSQLGLGLGLG